MRKIVCAYMAILTSAAMAADYQSCASIKLAKDRLACFDKFAMAQTAEAAASASVAKQAADLKATQDAEENSGKALVLAEIDRLKAALTARFKDPAAAQFKRVVGYGVAKPLRISFLCGEVNAKNSYGAYIGYKRFFMIGSAVSEIEDAKNVSLIESMWTTTCTGNEVYRQE